MRQSRRRVTSSSASKPTSGSTSTSGGTNQ
jgi:hypothetical protein